VNTAAEGIIPADVVCLFIQPLSETHIRAHLLMILDDQTSSMTDMVLFQQKIFTQDKPILENHLPLKLPLEKLEIPTKADALATAYRKWLIAKTGVMVYIKTPTGGMWHELKSITNGFSTRR
jgi:phenylpropionate dioxygenase-like ring-hydroxylating dioxygenase large terminal subunit